MSRRNAAVKRTVLPDPIYNSTVVTKVVNQVMLDGKRSIAQSVVYDAMEIRADRRQTLAIRWLVEYARKRTGERGMENKLAAEIVDANNSTGGAVKKKDDMHRQAEANKAFAHYKF